MSNVTSYYMIKSSRMIVYAKVVFYAWFLARLTYDMLMVPSITALWMRSKACIFLKLSRSVDCLCGGLFP